MTERPMKLYRHALERLTGAAFQPGSVSFASRPCRPEEDADTLLAFALDDLERLRHERDTATVPEMEELTKLRALLKTAREELVIEAFTCCQRTAEGRSQAATVAGNRVQEIHRQIDEALGAKS